MNNVIPQLQILILMITMLINPITTRLRMPIATEKYVELMCYYPFVNFIVPLAFNMILILLCR